MTVSAEIEDPRWTALEDAERVAQSCVAAALGQDPRSVHVLFTSDAAVRSLNRSFRGKDKPTNVLSFPSPAMPLPPGEVAHLGDIALAFETVASEAREQGKPLLNHASHLIVHGTLHLLGCDHETDTEAEAMEARERTILAGLGIPDPYLT
jgi:probable rRNA maturation factor